MRCFPSHVIRSAYEVPLFHVSASWRWWITTEEGHIKGSWSTLLWNNWLLTSPLRSWILFIPFHIYGKARLVQGLCVVHNMISARWLPTCCMLASLCTFTSLGPISSYLVSCSPSCWLSFKWHALLLKQAVHGRIVNCFPDFVLWKVNDMLPFCCSRADVNMPGMDGFLLIELIKTTMNFDILVACAFPPIPSWRPSKLL